jgi:hypothetical protein
VPVKDRYRKQDDEKNKVSGCEETNKNAAGASALRRVCKEGQDLLQRTDDQNFGGVSDGV